MPFKHNDAWHRQMREYLKENPRLAQVTARKYMGLWTRAYEMMGRPNPRDVTRRDMEAFALHYAQRHSSNTCAVDLRLVRMFLIFGGNAQAGRWKVSESLRPKVDGVFLREDAVARVRLTAHAMGLDHELIYSLGVDNGLRPVDMLRLTVRNAQEAISSRVSDIRGKGRNGGKVAAQAFNRMTPPLLVEYLQWRQKVVEETGWDSERLLIHVGRGGKGYGKPRPWTYKRILETVNDLSEESGIRFDPHDLRRTFGNRLKRRKVPLEDIAKAMRHENPDVTFKCYIGGELDDRLETMDKLCPEPLCQIPDRR